MKQMKCVEMLEKIKDISNDADIEKIEILIYENGKNEEFFKTTIKIEREIC